MGLIRAIAAVIVGVLLAYGFPWLLEGVLVQTYAGGRPMGSAAYFNIRNTLGLMAARVAMAFFLSVLAGHIAARVAKEDALRTVAISASAVSMVLLWDYTGGELAWGTPIWLRIAIVAITGPSMMLGAYVRAAVAELRAEQSEPGE
ncbi:MAG: hypothetical protein ABL986_01855 [Vicinamibacterales bacterium]